MTHGSRRSFLAASAGGLAGLAGCAVPWRSSTSDGTPSDGVTTTAGPSTVVDGLSVETLASGLEVPWDLDFGPGGELYFTERPGRIRRLDRDSGSLTTLASVSDTAAVGEGGLLGIALHPGFPDPPALFVYQTHRTDGLHNRVLQYRVDGDEATRVGTLLAGIPGAQIHDGGRLAIGPDGHLYATSGDASEAGRAQDRDSLAGKIHRVALDGSIPADNPFEGSPVWSYGHRNPEGLAWHPATDQLYAIEHGSSGHDEVNRIVAGANYGWPVVVGAGADDRFESPVLTSGAGTWAPSGGAFYDGDGFPDWQGDLLFATLGFSPGDGRRSLHRVRFGGDGQSVEAHERHLSNEFGRLRGVAVGPDGAIHLTTSNRDGRANPVASDDRILRVTLA